MDHLIIDGYNLVFRAHHAFITLQTPGGIPSGCVYGFLVGSRSIKKKFPDCHITIAWDTESVRRKQLDPTYKANRPQHHISNQIQDLKKIFTCVNVSQTEYINEEADDVIASLIKKYDQGIIYIYTSDKDLLQLVKDGRVLVVRPKKGAIPEKVYDEEAVKEEFGVSPEDLHSFLSLKGDTVDNIPGVVRVRASCLINLIKKYRTPRNIYANLKQEDLTGFERKSLEEAEQRVYLNTELVKLRDDLELSILEGAANEETLQGFIDKYALKSINPGTYIKAFLDLPSFNKRLSPAVESYSLFD